jgi:ribokinase
MAEVVVVGQVGRDLVLGVDAIPDGGGSASVRRRWEGLGGKGANQAVTCRQLGADVALVAVVGDDDAGADVVRQAERDGIDVTGVVRREGASTALLVDVVTPDATRRLLEDVPDDVLLRPDDVRPSAHLLEDARCVLLQLQQPADAVLEALRASGSAALLVADGAPGDEAARDELLAGVHVLRADDAEAALLVGSELSSLDDVVAAARDLVRRGPRVVALSAGSDGNVVAWPDGCVTVPLIGEDLSGRSTADPTGGGDAFVSALALHLLRRNAPADAAWWASAATALVVTRLGGRPHLSGGAVDDLAARARAALG